MNNAIEFFKWCNEPIYLKKGTISHESRVVPQQPDFEYFQIIDENGKNSLGRGKYLTAEELYDYWLQNVKNYE